jgi:hypothetical protein
VLDRILKFKLHGTSSSYGAQYMYKYKNSFRSNVFEVRLFEDKGFTITR